MKLKFLGAAKSVTGSMHMLELNGTRILMDCGLFQGRREESNRRNRNLPLDPKSVERVVLSHAHIDHSGNLPNLVKQGYSIVYVGNGMSDIYSSRMAIKVFATGDLVECCRRENLECTPFNDLHDVVRGLETLSSG